MLEEEVVCLWLPGCLAKDSPGFYPRWDGCTDKKEPAQVQVPKLYEVGGFAEWVKGRIRRAVF